MFSKNTLMTVGAIILIAAVLAAHIFFSKNIEGFSDVSEKQRNDNVFGYPYEHKSQELNCLIGRTIPKEIFCASVVGVEDRPQNSSSPRNFMDF
jgi:hypothetical protein